MSRTVRNKMSLPGRNIRKPNTYEPINISRPRKYKPIYPGEFILGESELL